MTKKKSFISLVLAICLIIPAMFMLTACGKTKTTVTAEEWASAFALEGQENYSVEVKLSTNPYYLSVFKRDGTKLYMKQVGDMYGSSDVMGESYYDKSGDTYMEYERSKTDNTKWSSTTYDADSYNGLLNGVSGEIAELNDYESFKYDEETKSYKAKSVIKDSVTVTNVVVKFADGLITSLEFVSEGATMAFNFSYCSVQLTIPTVE